MAFTPLNALSAFLAVGRLRSFSAAALELGISSSAVSQSVRQLETRLGVVLLTRTTRNVALTEAGQRLLASAGPGVEQALEALKTATARPGEVTGTVRLTVPSLAVYRTLVRLLPRFHARHPRVEVEIRVENYFVDIIAAGLDGGIRYNEAIELDMVQVRLCGPIRFLVVASPDYLKRKGVPQKPRDVLDHDCIGIRASTTSPPYQWEFEKGARSWRIPVRGPLLTNDATLMREMAEAGMGLMYASDLEVAPQLKRGTLVEVLEGYVPSVTGLYLYFPSRAQLSPALRAFVDVAREVGAAAAAETPEAASAPAPAYPPRRVRPRTTSRRRT